MRGGDSDTTGISPWKGLSSVQVVAKSKLDFSGSSALQPEYVDSIVRFTISGTGAINSDYSTADTIQKVADMTFSPNRLCSSEKADGTVRGSSTHESRRYTEDTT